SRFFFSSRRRHTRCYRDWSSDVCSSDLPPPAAPPVAQPGEFTRMFHSPGAPSAPPPAPPQNPQRYGSGGGATQAFSVPAAPPAQIGRASCRESVKDATGREAIDRRQESM